MRYYMYCEPAGENTGEPVYHVMSERGIYEGWYWDHWKERMEAIGKFLPNSLALMQELCLDDFCVVHWATEVTAEELARQFAQAPNPDNSKS